MANEAKDVQIIEAVSSKASRAIVRGASASQDCASRIRDNARNLKAGRFSDAELVELVQKDRR